MGSEIKRYGLWYDGRNVAPFAESQGSWVTHSDHLAAVGEMQKQIEALRAECRAWRGEQAADEVARIQSVVAAMSDTDAALGEQP